VVWVVTGWPAVAVAVAGGWVVLPGVMVARREPRAAAARSEAIARWTELLRDNLAAGTGLEQAITVSAHAAPTQIAPQVERLAARLERWPLPEAVRAFGEELADPAGDVVAATLITATTRQTSQLVPLLGELARSTREVARMHERVTAARASTFQAVRTITAAVLGFVALLVVFSRSWLTPYSTVVGQGWLLLVGGGFVAGLWWLHRLAVIPAMPRVLQRGDR
jgi:tight adherence protein B